MSTTDVILVDNEDNELGTMEKMEVHKKGLLHRAISVFITTSSGEWIMQRRAMDKYHSKGLWTNTCCSHPYPGETNIDAAKRRLMEEMGLQSKIKEAFSFIYKETLDSGLIEHEYDHVFIGVTDNEPVINTNEVLEWEKINYHQLHSDVQHNPESYTYWFKKIYEKVNSYIEQEKK